MDKKKIRENHAFAICMAMDAFRIAIGMKPKDFEADDVLRWLAIVIKSGLK